MRLRTSQKIVWCPGCGNYGILRAFIRVLERLGEDARKVVVVSGVGCHGKIADYVGTSSFHTIHGRVPPVLTGIKLANRELIPVGFAGDGDAYNEGIAHLLHAARKNTDVTVVVHNNSVYALTTGQATATRPKGFRGKSTPRGAPEDPLNPAALLIASGAGFVARGFSGNVAQLSELMLQGISHRGFSFIDVLQPCVAFNNTWEVLRERVHPVEPGRSRDEALRLAYNPFATGVLYREAKAVYEDSVVAGVPEGTVEEVLESLR